MLIKKELSEILVLNFPAINKKELKRYSYSSSAEVRNLRRSGRILAVDIFDIEKHTLKLRFFSDGVTYLTFINDAAKKWSKCRPHSLLDYNNIFSTKEDDELVRDFLQAGRQSWKFGSTVESCIEGFVHYITAKKSCQAAERKDKLMKKHFNMFPDYPKDLQEYCEKHVFEHTYIFVGKVEKGYRQAVCGYCKSKYSLEKTKSNPGSFGVCPKCGFNGKYRGTWATSSIEEKAKICIAHKVDGQLLLRWTDIIRKFIDTKCKYEFYDYYRTLYLNTPKGNIIYSYNYIYAAFHGWDWFRKKNGTVNCEKAHIYTLNLNNVFGSAYYHVDLAAGLTNAGEISFTGLLDNLKNIPAAEYLFKMGLSTFAANMRAEDLRTGNGFSNVLGVSKQYLPMYRKYNVDVHEHRVIQASTSWVSDESFVKFRALKAERNDIGEVISFVKRMSFEKFVNYFEKQKSLLKRKLNFLMTLYRDYISMSESLKVDLSRKSICFPKNIKESHDLIVNRFNKVKHEIEDENLRQAKEKLYAGMTEYRKDGYCIVFPQLRSDFIAEGQSLNHCVGADLYYKNHIEGTKMIFFVRQASEPDKPYFTMEIDMRELRIRQLYGFGDCSPSADVRKFANEFLRLLKPADSAGVS